jgi:thiamine-phosphate pyrophosphorylase
LHSIPQIYPITDTRISGLSHAEQVQRLIAGGASLIQIREKYAASDEFYHSALAAAAVAKAYGVSLIINDRVDIAIAVGAAGVHLGQDDLPPAEARAMLGPKAIIGFSTHTIDQARAAAALPVDYIAFGPIFPTGTKQNPDEIVGLEGLREAKRVIGDLPLVAIGGINGSNLTSVLTAGADSAAMIGALISVPANITLRMQKLAALAQQNLDLDVKHS